SERRHLVAVAVLPSRVTIPDAAQDAGLVHRAESRRPGGRDLTERARAAGCGELCASYRSGGADARPAALRQRREPDSELDCAGRPLRRATQSARSALLQDLE